MKNLTYIFLIIFFTGCANGRNSAMARIEEQFRQSLGTVTGSQDITSEIYMVIPRAGCSSCISGAENYMMETLKDTEKSSQFKFILTDFDSEKLLRARFGDLFKSQQLIIDPNNVFRANKSLKSLYPTIYFFDDDSHLIQVSEVSPEKDGLADIAVYMNNKLAKR